MSIIILPKEVICIILSYCGFSDTVKCMSISKTFNSICNNNLLWLQFLKTSKYKTFTGNYVLDYKSNYILEKFSQRSNIKFEKLFDHRLELSNNQLTTIPKELGQLTNLRYLYLSNNQLTTIPKELGQLTNLQYLYLYNNKLTTIPEELRQLTNLRELYLFNNQLKTIPKELGQLTNLQYLNLSNNQLRIIPTELGQLTN